MNALFTAVALVGFGVAAWRIACALLDDDARCRAAVALVLGSAMLCASYGILGQLCERRAADVELVFHGDPVAAPRTSRNEGAGELRVIDDIVTRARATPGALCVFALPCFVASFALRRRKRVSRAHDRRLWLFAIPLGLAGLSALWSTPRGYDALWYHLPLAAAFARNGHLEPPGRDLVFYFPGNVELVARSLFDLFGPVLGARALSLVQLPYAFAIAPISTAIARRLGAGGASIYAGAMAIASPMIVFQAGLGYADVVSLAGIGAALIFLFDALYRPGRVLPHALAAGACLGFVLGSKYAAVPLLATLAPIVVIVAWRRGRPLVPFLIAIGVVLPAWFWYARNLRLSGNPFFPIAIPSLGLRGLFVGDAFNRGKELELVASRAEWLAYPWLENLSHESGFGAAFVALLPMIPLLMGRALQKLRRASLPLAWGTLYVATWWIATPHEVRHLAPLLFFFGAPAVVLLRGTSERARGLRHVVTTALALALVVNLRLLFFSPVAELSLRPIDFESLYGLPASVIDGLPPEAKIANLASRPYNLAVLGTDARRALFDFSPDASTATLLDRGATHVLLRGPSMSVDAQRARLNPAATWRVIYRSPVAASTHSARVVMWGGAPTDIVVVYAVPGTGAAKVGGGKILP